MIKLPTSLLRIVTNSAKVSYPFEACGLLAGYLRQNKNYVITRVIRSRNISETDKRCNFEIDPKVYFDLKRDLDFQNYSKSCKEIILGNYHSHPNQPAYPSKTDSIMANQTSQIWLITSIDKKKDLFTTGHIFDHQTKNFEELPLHIIK